MKQGTLFETETPTNQYGYPISAPIEQERKQVHAGDPEASREAVRKHVRSGKAGAHRQLILSALRDEDGQTGYELARVTGLNQVEVVRRLSDLKREFFVESRKSSVPCRVNPDSVQSRWFLRRGTNVGD